MKVYSALILLLVILPAGCVDTSSPNIQDPCDDFDEAAQKEYLNQNAQEEGVNVTDSGLQYEVLEEGDGEQPSANSTVRVDYELRFIDGNVFESTQNSGPIELNLAQNLIEGFVEGLLLMNEGATYELTLPSELAYGQTGNRGICPGATLIFEVTLVEIV